MSNRLCPKCGEEYSDTYRKCPFCEEEEAIRRGRPIKRRGGKRLSKKKRSSGAGSVMLAVMAVVIIGVVGYVYFGEQVADFMGIRTQNDITDQGPKDPAVPVTDDKEPDAPVEPDGGDVGVPDVPVEPAGPLALDQEAITIPSGETARLTATGGAGAVTWSSSNENIATVADGAVTGVAGGTITITATAGEETVTCSVTVTGEPWVNPIQWKLNKTDVTEPVNGNGFQLKVEGCTSPIVWASDKPSAVTVTEDGWVKRVGKGRAIITATVDGQVLSCIVR